MILFLNTLSSSSRLYCRVDGIIIFVHCCFLTGNTRETSNWQSLWIYHPDSILYPVSYIFRIQVTFLNSSFFNFGHSLIENFLICLVTKIGYNSLLFRSQQITAPYVQVLHKARCIPLPRSEKFLSFQDDVWPRYSVVMLLVPRGSRMPYGFLVLFQRIWWRSSRPKCWAWLMIIVFAFGMCPTFLNRSWQPNTS